MATIAMLHNPFDLTRNREVHAVVESITIRAWLDIKGITEFSKPTICIVDGQPVLRRDWHEMLIQGDMIVTFIALPQGGGGGGKNPLRTILTIAVIVAAPALGAALATSLGVTSAIGVAMIGGAIAFAGSALVNILIPPPSPSLGGGIGNFNSSQPSPTYSLQAQGNQARLAEPIPVIYGRHIVYPDFAATPYSEFSNNDQFLYQLHIIGQGEYNIEQIRIEDTPISSFEEITSQIIPPGGSLTLFHHDVAAAPEVAGQELLSTGDGGTWVGPFVANPPETLTNKISIDIVLPRGLYYANDAGGLTALSAVWEVQARLINDNGDPLGSWVTLGMETITAATNTPIRRTFQYAVSPGRYEIKLLRQNNKDFSSRSGNDLNWSGLNSFLQSSPDFSGLTLLALKMRATDNLSQRSSRMVNCIVTRKLPVWSGSGWTAPQPTRSIAWAMADVLKANYGAKLGDGRIDITTLTTLDELWQARGDNFDGIFDQKLTVWDALGRIARCGRAVPILQGGITRVVRDEQKSLPVALFSPRNIVKGSFKIDYVMPGDDTADAVTVEFFNANIWKTDEITASLSGSAAEQPAKVSLFGCTNEAHAMREGLYMAAANRYRRRMVTFRTELEGMIPTYGDLIALAHDMPRWGSAGDIIAVNMPTLKLSEPVEFAETGTHYIILRRRDGSVSGPYEVLPGDNNDEVLLQDEIDFIPFTGTTEERTHFSFGIAEKWATLARVLSVKPRSEQVEISCVIENNLVHSADEI